MSRVAKQVLLMVHELHKLGYQRLRIVPGMAPSGMAWRCSVTHIGNIQRRHGAMLSDFNRDAAAHYTTAMGDHYFGWEDATQDTARQLADKFLARFPAIAELGKGADEAYAGWYVEMLELAKRGDFPVAYSDLRGEYDEPDPRWLPTTAGVDSGLPMPPPGEGVTPPEDLDAEPNLAPDVQRGAAPKTVPEMERSPGSSASSRRVSTRERVSVERCVVCRKVSPISMGKFKERSVMETGLTAGDVLRAASVLAPADPTPRVFLCNTCFARRRTRELWLWIIYALLAAIASLPLITGAVSLQDIVGK